MMFGLPFNNSKQKLPVLNSSKETYFCNVLTDKELHRTDINSNLKSLIQKTLSANQRPGIMLNYNIVANTNQIQFQNTKYQTS